jgi:hypothetical protein
MKDWAINLSRNRRAIAIQIKIAFSIEGVGSLQNNSLRYDDILWRVSAANRAAQCIPCGGGWPMAKI